ncbi:hypothetical protein L228DRAFT_134973 [Xylona heveae TC161]|uniref:ATP-dependent protease n=1 Tax=Xylona heveae (strain CBS 132557 / TC161) TaxID=1328760 RepID=A0A165GXW5_XYLHT|nr:hypothetical protein L228DRAFT_134973 [Xylona heveae TC161]KZF22740.1 hypothetical protein L228DRAFT_134973 [Xylona heveae TC161]
MSADASVGALSERTGFDAYRDARAIIRLIQCSRCSYPLRVPVTLPCGNTICRMCLPRSHVRAGISYPANQERQEGFTCPFSDCTKEHSLADSNPDVVLGKVLELIGEEVAKCKTESSEKPMLLEEQAVVHPSMASSGLQFDRPRSRVLHGGRLLATYTFAEMGELAFNSDVIYKPLYDDEDGGLALDMMLLDRLKEVVRNEFDCQVCYALMLNPVTTPCGHTFCRRCLTRVLDHSLLCPLCRRSLSISPALTNEPNNERICRILATICPEHLASRTETVTREEQGALGESQVPLFVCTLSFPSMPTFLHIFEPRYRLMIRRTLETRTRTFGMVSYNRTREPQGNLGTVEFREYGTLLRIINAQMLPDGRSLIETVGVSRFKVKDWSILDGYVVGSIDRYDDISLVEEERIEAAETDPARRSNANGSSSPTAQLDHLSTRDLLDIGMNFIRRMRDNSAPWLHQRVLEAYGYPPEDPALFPYWFASVLPISEHEKYKLLPTRSVRERLKITARWVRRAESQRWYSGTCTVL